jgi:DNA-binding transcriptional MerR regulator/methylmalonyl-CoA mutase cobalamin-binding subunit
VYSIKATSQATGLSVETLRAWERRYGVVEPQRDGSGRRAYGPADVLRLRRLREATDRGHPIGRLASLSEEGLSRLLAESPGSLPGEGENAPNAFVTRLLEAARSYDATACEQALVLAIALLEPRRLAGEVLHPVLVEVGRRWHSGEFSISQERLLSSAVRRHLSLVLDTVNRHAHREQIVFATLPGERHEFGLLMAAVACAGRGFRVHYLGPDLPAAEIARFAREVDAGITALSVVLHERLPDLPQQLATLVAGLEPDAAVWLGGAATAELDPATLPPRCVVVGNALELERRLDLLAV